MESKSIIKKLAGDTLVYGMSTMVARFINFFLVSVYTYFLTTNDYGVLTEFMAYIAVFQVLLTMGLETGCFRHVNKEGASADTVYSNALISISSISSLLLFVLVLWGRSLAQSMGYTDYYSSYVLVGVILMLDSISAIVFAKLRIESKPWRFASIKTVKICVEIGSNLLLFFFFPAYAESHPDSFLLKVISPSPDFSYPIFSIALSCVIVMLLLLKDFLSIRFRPNIREWKSMMLYSLPLMIAGLPGIVNDFLDRILFRFFNVDDALWRSELGVYQAAVKISVLMSIFAQMFRFAAEPFFFARSKDVNSKELYAQVMEYFVAASMLVFLGVVLYIDVLELIVGSEFRGGMGVVPIMLLSYVFMGILFNVSMWYKLTDRSHYAIYITLAGLAVSTVINVVFLPLYSFWAAAWGHFFSYLFMLLISVRLGNKYYKIPYRWWKISLIIVLAVMLWGLSTLLPEMSLGLKLFAHTGVVVFYIGLLYVTMFKVQLRSVPVNCDDNEKI